MRNALLLFHRWVALVTSLLIFIAAATGSALVFEGALDRALNPRLWSVAPAGQSLSLDTLAAHARALTPKATITGVTLPSEPDRAVVVQTNGVQAFVDPFTGRVLGTRSNDDYNASLPRRLHVLHVSLMVRGWGSSVVALVTVASFLLTITGMVLWWRDRIVRVRWSASWKRIVFDLHHSLGILASLVLCIITASGIAIHYPLARRAIAQLDATPRQPPPGQPHALGVTTDVSLDSAARVARTALPGAAITFIATPAKSTQPFVVAMRFPEDRTPGGRSRVYIDRFRGAVLMAESTRQAQRGTAINSQMRSLHTGDLLGKPTEAIWFLAALVMAAQSITGLLMWWNGRHARAALARKAAAS